MLPKTHSKRPGSAAEKDKAWLLLGGVADHLAPVRLWIEYEVERVGYFTPVELPADAEAPGEAVH